MSWNVGERNLSSINIKWSIYGRVHRVRRHSGNCRHICLHVAQNILSSVAHSFRDARISWTTLSHPHRLVEGRLHTARGRVCKLAYDGVATLFPRKTANHRHVKRSPNAPPPTMDMGSIFQTQSNRMQSMDGSNPCPTLPSPTLHTKQVQIKKNTAKIYWLHKARLKTQLKPTRRLFYRNHESKYPQSASTFGAVSHAH